MKVFRSGDRIRDIERVIQRGAGFLVEGHNEIDWLQVLRATLTPEDAVALGEMLEFLRGAWERISDADRAHLCFIVVIPKQKTIWISSGSPGLVIHKGSISFRALCGSIRIAGPLLGFFLKKGVAPTRQMKTLIKEMRTKLLEHEEVFPLESLEELQIANRHTSKVMLVFVHGLMGTDVGTFDGFISALRSELIAEARKSIAEQLLKRIIIKHGESALSWISLDRMTAPAEKIADRALNDVLTFVGWPHDTLTEIEKNGLHLAKLLSRRDSLADTPDIIFVCHSRGGLVARTAIARLIAAREVWRRRIKGCLTFGTPHEGADLAEFPSKFMGPLLALQILVGSKTVAALPASLSMLCQKKFAGISDLRRGGKFLSRLELQEERLQKKARKDQVVRFFAVGGHFKSSVKFLNWISSHAFADEPNDCVVEMESSAPKSQQIAWSTEQVECHHFGYFERPSKEAVKFVCSSIASKAVAARAHELAESEPIPNPPETETRSVTRRFRGLDLPVEPHAVKWQLESGGDLKSRDFSNLNEAMLFACTVLEQNPIDIWIADLDAEASGLSGRVRDRQEVIDFCKKARASSV